MNVALIGIGQAGGNIVERVIDYDDQTSGQFVDTGIVIDSDSTDLNEREAIPRKNRVLVGEDRVKGRGVGSDNELGVKVVEADLDRIQASIDAGMGPEADAVLVVAALGGGTGSGGAPVLARHLQHHYETPVYGLAVLPSAGRGGIYHLNAARSFQTFVDMTDNLLVFDNDAWPEDDGAGYELLNEELVKRIGLLFNAAGNEATHGSATGVTTADLVETLSGGNVSTVGYAAEAVETDSGGLLSRFTGGTDESPDDVTVTNRITSLVRKSTLGRLTLPCEVEPTERSLLLVSGPPAQINRTGIERGRQWLEDQTRSEAVRDAEYPLSSTDHVASVVLLSGVTNVPRIDELEEIIRRVKEKNADDESADETASTEESETDDVTTETGEATATETDSDSPADSTDDTASHTADSASETSREGTTRRDEPDRTRYEPSTVPDVPALDVYHDDIEKQEPIGSGGNADVYLATVRDGGSPLTVALKEPRMEGTLHTESIERLLDEAETWQQLDSHDHVVGLVDYGSSPLPWIAMEYMDGGHLGERAGKMRTSQALWTAIAVTDGVHHAHRHGIAHLDLKPANVLFRSVENGWDVPKVADWGLSKHLLDHSNSAAGLSAQYAAPEQFDDDYGRVDDITDVYQLGAVCYELFTGRPPFEGTPANVMESVLNEQPIPPSEVADVPATVDEPILTALATDRDDRYESVILLRKELEGLYNED